MSSGKGKTALVKMCEWWYSDAYLQSSEQYFRIYHDYKQAIIIRRKAVRTRRVKQILHAVNYRIPPELDDVIAQRAAQANISINSMGIRMLTFAAEEMPDEQHDAPRHLPAPDSRSPRG